MQRIEIQISKRKIILLVLGSLAFVAAGLWFIIAPPKIENPFWGDPIKIMIVGYACVIFFGLCALAFIRKLLNTTPGLIIDEKGLADHSSGVSAGEILWSDIQNITVTEIHRQKLILIHIKNPQEYIDRQTSYFKRKVMALNNRMYGTPLILSANGLKISFDELFKLVIDNFNSSRHIRLSSM